jgi:MazG family protein
MNTREEKMQAFGRLLDIMDELREKCPWDRKQTNESLRTNTIEETFELCEAIVRQDEQSIKKELGDVLLHIVFYSKIGEEKGEFDIRDVCDALCDKLIFRHPHVFGDDRIDSAKKVEQSWEQIKLREKDGNRTVLEGVPASLPSLPKAHRIQDKARNAGFDWVEREDVWDKVEEEIAELRQEIRAMDEDRMEGEFGDLFFSLVNAARLYKINPDNALERTNQKFIRRFNYMEQEALKQDRNIKDMALAELDTLWEKAKKHMATLSCIAFLACFSLHSSAQESAPVLSMDSAVTNMSRQIRMFPQEKLYLQTDKPYYITGEKIFFRAHLVDALMNVPASVSRYVYVELLNPLDSAVVRVKIRPDDGMFFGHIPLFEDMPEGVYKLRAYTSFMKNVGEDYFFTKTVRIGDPHVLNIRTETDFSFEGDKKVIMNIRFADLQMDEYLKPKTLSVRINNGETMTVKPDRDGVADVKFNLSADERMRIAYVELPESRVYRQYIRIPYPGDRFDVSFYPEGGYLVGDAHCNVTFKAMHSNGSAAAVSGEVFDSRGESVASLTTFHEGKGNFVLTPRAGEKYYAVCKNENGTEMRFDLPEVRPDAVTLRVNMLKDRFWIAVNRSAQQAQDTLHLMVHQNGVVHYADTWDNSREYVLVDQHDFSSGIVHFILLSTDMQVLSERLAFVWNDDQAQVSFETDRPAYGRREKISATARVSDASGGLPAGTFSVAVTDDREVKIDSCRNIMEYFLLSSGLKGTVENPAFYLKRDKKSQIAMDLLMMTHGWRRYDIPNVLKGKFTKLSEPLEIGQEISGVIRGGLLDRPSDKARISILAPKEQYVDMTEADKKGVFVFRGFEYPDSTQYVVHATSKKGWSTVEVHLDREKFPSSSSPWVYTQPDDDRTFLDYITKADRKYSYENGMRLIDLDEVTVTARKKDAGNKYSSIYGTADNSFTEEELEKMGSFSIRDMLSRFPGVRVGPDQISVRGSSGNPLLMVDNTEMDIEMLDMLNVHDIAQIDLLKSVSHLAMFGSRGANGVISIYTKRGEVSFRRELLNVSTYMPLGYQRPLEFYAPKYDTPEKLSDDTPDLRTTIYWQPNVKIDETGAAAFDFYTADTETTYSAVIEGVTQNGKILRHVAKIIRK